MALAYHLASGLSILLFLYYGLLCLFAKGMADDFERFGIPRLRRPTGVLEILGALGLAVGYGLPVVAASSAAGLAILMLAAIAARVKARDTLVSMLPAAFLFCTNAFIALQVLRRD